MKRIKIDDTNDRLFVWAWNLYKKSFPPEERRQLQVQRSAMATAKQYIFEVIIDDNSAPIGLFLWWKFEDMRYIEHFAIAPEFRNQGYGKEIMASFITESNSPVALEVEIPSDEIKTRRINFYKRLGFIINKAEYFQPPYKVNGQPVKMLLATYPRPYTADDINIFCKKYHHIIHRSVIDERLYKRFSYRTQ